MNAVNSTNYVFRAESYESVTLFKQTITSNYATSLAYKGFWHRGITLYTSTHKHTLLVLVLRTPNWTELLHLVINSSALIT